MKMTNNRQHIICGLCLLLVATCFWGCRPERIETGKPVDVDGNVYDTVRIGNQTWMAQDLLVTHLPDKTPLRRFGIRQSAPAFTTYGNKMLYNSFAAQYGANSGGAYIQGICPDGWHLPSSDEYQQLIEYVATHSERWDLSGSVSRAMASQQWGGASSSASFNQTGFSALPTGYVHSYDSHSDIGDNRWTERGNAYYWCADHNDYYPRPNSNPDYPGTPNWGVYGTDSLEIQSFVLLLDINREEPEISSLPDIHYCAVRCVKD